MTSGNITATFTPIVLNKEFASSLPSLTRFTIKAEAKERSSVYPQSIEAWQLGRNGQGELCLRGYEKEPMSMSPFLQKIKKKDESKVFQYVLCNSGKLYVFSYDILVHFNSKGYETSFYNYKYINEKSQTNYIGHLTFAAADHYLSMHGRYDPDACAQCFNDEQNVQKVSVIMAGLLTFNDDGKSVKWANTGSGHFKPADKDDKVLQRVQNFMIEGLCIGNKQTKFGDFKFDDQVFRLFNNTLFSNDDDDDDDDANANK